MNRRSFLQTTAAAPFFIKNLISAPPSGKLRLAAFGASNMAYVTLQQIARNPNVTLVAAAEVDSSRTGQLKQNFPDAKVYQDWREMLKKERKNVDIACIGTPDHMHAPMAMSAMREGIHVYVQKPLAHDIYEIRKLTEYARKKKLVSQMGIQVHSSREYQTAVAVIHSLAIGKVKEVHSWSNKKWGDMTPMPDRTDPVPPTLDWDVWLGVASKRPFIGGGYYHTENWRKRLDFGTATFGDMGCHIYDPVFGALKLTAPISIRSEGPAPTQHNWAVDSVIKYTFPGTDVTEGKTVGVTWYDGDKRPPEEIQKLLGSVRMPGQGSIFIGTKGVMLLPHSAIPTLLPADNFRDFKMPQIEPLNHYFQFVETVLGKSKTTCSFDYSGPLTEAVLLGPLATHFPNTTLEWDSKKMKFKSSPEATRLVRRTYRDGWHVKGLS
jgi:predicted dehydrogenase